MNKARVLSYSLSWRPLNVSGGELMNVTVPHNITTHTLTGLSPDTWYNVILYATSAAGGRKLTERIFRTADRVASTNTVDVIVISILTAVGFVIVIAIIIGIYRLHRKLRKHVSIKVPTPLFSPCSSSGDDFSLHNIGDFSYNERDRLNPEDDGRSSSVISSVAGESSTRTSSSSEDCTRPLINSGSGARRHADFSQAATASGGDGVAAERWQLATAAFHQVQRHTNAVVQLDSSTAEPEHLLIASPVPQVLNAVSGPACSQLQVSASAQSSDPQISPITPMTAEQEFNDELSSDDDNSPVRVDPDHHSNNSNISTSGNSSNGGVHSGQPDPLYSTNANMSDSADYGRVRTDHPEPSYNTNISRSGNSSSGTVHLRQPDPLSNTNASMFDSADSATVHTDHSEPLHSTDISRAASSNNGATHPDPSFDPLSNMNSSMSDSADNGAVRLNQPEQSECPHNSDPSPDDDYDTVHFADTSSYSSSEGSTAAATASSEEMHRQSHQVRETDKNYSGRSDQSTDMYRSASLTGVNEEERLNNEFGPPKLPQPSSMDERNDDDDGNADEYSLAQAGTS
jgi:hypothetical protein